MQNMELKLLYEVCDGKKFIN